MNITWSIDQLIRKAGTGAVITAHWRCVASEGELSAAAIGPEAFADPDPSAPGFIPFEQLTEGQVVAWVKTQMGQPAVDALEMRLIAEVEALAAPAEVPGLPWAPPQTPAPAPDPVPQ